MAKRKPIAPILASKFSAEYNAAMLQYNIFEKIELTKYLISVFNTYLETKEPNKSVLKLHKNELEEIKKKLGKNYKAFKQAQFYKYFDFDIVIAEKKIYKDKEFNELEEQNMSDYEIETFLKMGINILEFELDKFYMEIDSSENENLGDTSSKLSNAKSIVKSKVTRDKDDKLTILNQKETTLLLAHLRQANVFLKEDYCKPAQAGLAMNILTGYSFKTISQDLVHKNLIDSKENRSELKAILTRILVSIDKGLTE